MGKCRQFGFRIIKQKREIKIVVAQNSYDSFNVILGLIYNTNINSRRRMGKKMRSNPAEKQQYFFVLKGSKTTYYKTKIQADFTPTKQIPNIPTYNQDRLYFTPAFIVPTLYATTQTNYQIEHQNKILATAEKSSSNIYVPKPKPKKNFCGVCSKEYEDYLEHINCSRHKMELKNSKFYFEISNLCDKFKSLSQIGKSMGTDGIMSKSTLGGQTQEEDSTTKQFISKVEGQQENQQDENEGKLGVFKDELYL